MFVNLHLMQIISCRLIPRLSENHLGLSHVHNAVSGTYLKHGVITGFTFLPNRLLHVPVLKIISRLKGLYNALSHPVEPPRSIFFQYSHPVRSLTLTLAINPVDLSGVCFCDVVQTKLRFLVMCSWSQWIFCQLPNFP